MEEKQKQYFKYGLDYIAKRLLDTQNKGNKGMSIFGIYLYLAFF